MCAGSVPFPRPENNTAFLNFAAAAKTIAKAPDSLDLPDGLRRQSPEQLVMRSTAYTSLSEVLDSDHKPVVARLRAEVPSFDHKLRRRHVQRVLSDFHNEVNAHMVCRRLTCCAVLLLSLLLWLLHGVQMRCGREGGMHCRV